VTIKTKVRDPAAVLAACKRLGLAAPVQGTAKLYSGEATGLLVQLPGWRYPAVIDTATGEVRYDNYGGCWGEQKEMDRFLQAYAAEKPRRGARGQGPAVGDQQLPDGSVRLRITEGG